MSDPSKHSSWNILIVDDDDAVRRMLARMLQPEGHNVVEASSALNALRALEEGPVDLVITDVLMPDMDGLELIRQIRRLPRAPRVIVISGGGRAITGTYLEFARQFGADGTLSKPLSAADLRSKVSEVMGSQR